MDRYPDDLFEQVRQLTARVAQLEAQLQQRAPLTSASQGWRLSDMSIPSVAAGEIHIGSAGGEFFSVNSAGTVKRMFVQAAAVATQAALETDVSAPASYSATWGQRVRNDLVATRATVFELQTSLRNSGRLAI